jgi:hypothetical protein
MGEDDRMMLSGQTDECLSRLEMICREVQA